MKYTTQRERILSKHREARRHTYQRHPTSLCSGMLPSMSTLILILDTTSTLHLISDDVGTVLVILILIRTILFIFIFYIIYYYYIYYIFESCRKKYSKNCLPSTHSEKAASKNRTTACSPIFARMT
jgi:hypothetical protein